MLSSHAIPEAASAVPGNLLRDIRKGRPLFMKKKKTAFFSALLILSLLTADIFSPLTVMAKVPSESAVSGENASAAGTSDSSEEALSEDGISDSSEEALPDAITSDASEETLPDDGTSDASEEALSEDSTSDFFPEETEDAFYDGYSDPGYHVEAAHEEESLNGEAAKRAYALVDVASYFPSLGHDFDLDPALPVTPVRDQGRFSLCWAFAATACMESNILKTYGGDRYALDLSELETAYYTQNRSAANQPEGCRGDTLTLLDSFGNVGGNPHEVVTALSAWRGVVDETTAPYTDLENGTLSTALTGGSLAGGKMSYYLTDAELTSGSDINRIKNLLTQRGALDTSIFYRSSYYNDDTHALYNNEESTTSHAVTIVGWDDDYPKENFRKWPDKENNGQPEKNGAWLIKNSHGTMSNSGGYFWVSYEDKSLAFSDVYAFQMAKADSSYDHNYQYDGGKDNAFYTVYDTSVRMANVFTAKGEENLKAVSFWTYNQDLNYDISVYKNVKDTPESGVLQSEASVSGSLSYAGYHTVALPAPTALSAGEKYAVVIKLTGDGESPLYIVLERNVFGDANFKSSIECHAGESFISSDNETWTDAASLKDIEPLYQDTGNIRIKAFTDDVEAPAVLTAQRLSGKTRYETMALIAREAFPEGADEAILVTGEKFPDGLTASALAGARGCPILLTRLDELNQPLITLLRDTWQGRVKKLYLIGSGFSEEVRQKLRTLCGVEVLDDTSMAGSNRYDTANKVCQTGLDNGTFTTDACILATGNEPADAMAMSPWAYYYHIPILLANNGELSEATRQLASRFKTVYVAGASKVVHDQAVSALPGNVMRFYGDNRYETALAIARAFVPANTDNPLLPLHEESFDTSFVFAVGQKENFPDALAGAALAGHTDGDDLSFPSALILVNKNGQTPSVNDYLQTITVSTDHPVKASFLGAVSEEMQEELLSYFHQDRQ